MASRRVMIFFSVFRKTTKPAIVLCMDYTAQIECTPWKNNSIAGIDFALSVNQEQHTELGAFRMRVFTLWPVLLHWPEDYASETVATSPKATRQSHVCWHSDLNPMFAAAPSVMKYECVEMQMSEE